MKVLLNCTTLVKGGALQAAASFISVALKKSDKIVWHLALSRQVFDELKYQGLHLNIENATIIEPSPAKSLQSRKQLKDLEASITPNVIFTFFGPAYVRFDSPHLCGIANPWVTHSSLLAFRTIARLGETLTISLKILYQAYWYKKANAWVTELAAAREGLVRRFFFNKGKIEVVSNNCSKQYFEAAEDPRRPSAHEKFRILCFSAYYRHKNLEIIPLVAAQIILLGDIGKDFEFIVTLPYDSQGLKAIMQLATKLGVEKHINNVGPIRVADGPTLYHQSHILFLPSVLETFSANYPEAMAMGVPIVTTDLHFAREVCQEAANYFIPKDPTSAAKAIISILTDKTRWQTLVKNGIEISKSLPSPEEKYNQYVSCLENLYSSTKTL